MPATETRSPGFLQAVDGFLTLMGKAARYLRTYGLAAFIRKVDERLYALRTTRFGPARQPLLQAYYALLRAALPDPQDSDYVPLAGAGISSADAPVKLIAFYLPQFHPIPENDAWWGRGFTEWTNTSKAVPQFLGHYQPHLPGELGFYDLRLPHVQRRQVELARTYGIHGFAFYYYWFNGRRLLEGPLEQFISDPRIDFPYCICWANESWTRRWDNNEDELLLKQEHTDESDTSFIRDVERFLRDPRYIRIGGKPILIVYRVQLLRDPQATAATWRDYCRQVGIGEIYLMAAQSYGFEDPRPAGFDAAVEFPPHNSSLQSINRSLKILNPWYAGSVFDYRQFAAQYAGRPAELPYELFKTVSPAWDNEPRKPGNGTSFAFSTPAAYQNWLSSVCQQALAKEPDKRLVFINAWNEWAEGAHLEPDRRYGYAYLQATMNALRGLPKPASHTDSITGAIHPVRSNGMRSQYLDLKKYGTDKIPNGFFDTYDPVFADYVDKELNLLELGVLDGGSMLLWRDYFPKGQIFGVDLKLPPQLQGEDRIHLFQGSQADPGFLSQVAAHASGGFDIIIDDASHMGRLTSIGFWHLFDNHLKPGGLYIIEDWGTGYWSDWPDGAHFNPGGRLRNAARALIERRGPHQGTYFHSHPFGMVGFVKQLIDEQGYANLSRGALASTRAERGSRFQSVTVTAAMVIVKKC
jgi:hypothetical protein